jgi:predicted amidohydrolase YtcJ
MSFELDLLLRGATVHTMDPAHPSAHSVGIWHGRFIGVDEELEGLGAAQVLELDGATVLPGFHDAHCHTTSYGVSATQLELSDEPTIDAVLDRVAAHASGLSGDGWVIGVGYLDRTGTDRHPTAAELDRAGGGRPVWLTHRSGHMCAVSTPVLRMLPDPLPANAVDYVHRDTSAEPSGLLEEAAMELVKEVVGPGSVAQMVAAIEVATLQYAGEGVTSITEAGIGCPGVDHSPLEIGAWQLAARAGRAHTRAHLMVYNELFHDLPHHPDDAARFGLDLGLHTGFGDARVRISAMKVWLDGAGSAGQAATDHDDSLLVDDPRRLRRHVVAAHRAGWQVAAHAMGDHAVDLFLDALEEAGPSAEVRRRRHRIEHGGLIRPDQLDRLRRLGVAVAIQPAFIPEFGATLARHFGADRVDWSIRAASLLAEGIVVAASSDRPVAPGAPLHGVQAMVERLTDGGEVYGAAERVSAETALRAYTAGAAYAAGFEHELGAITSRQLADLVVLDADPTVVETAEIGGIGVLATLLGGAATHDPGGLFAARRPDVLE